jgi:putative transposase
MKKLDNKRLKAYKYRIYPNKEQELFFIKTFGCVRFVWNLMLAEKLSAYEKREKIPRVTPAKYKSEYPFLKEVDSLALCNVQIQLEKAFRDHFKNKKHFGPPKFKKKKDKQSYTTNNNNDNIKVDFEKGLLYLPKIKTGIKIKIHRTITGQIKSATVRMTKDGKYYVSILVETENVRNKVKEPKSKACGIDLGLEHFVIFTNDFGTGKIEHPKYLRIAEKRLKRLQRVLSRKQKGSKNREKAQLKLAKLHVYISNARNDFLHKLSKAIIDENQVVVVEDINVKGLLNSNLSKSISDSGWSKFVEYLRYKAEWYGKTFIQVDRFFPSSKLCYYCGYKKYDLNLSDRYWTCPVCGTYHDRDINASINLYKIGMERPDFKPVEHALVDDRIPFGIPKKPSCVEAGSHTFKVG